MQDYLGFLFASTPLSFVCAVDFATMHSRAGLTCAHLGDFGGLACS